MYSCNNSARRLPREQASPSCVSSTSNLRHDRGNKRCSLPAKSVGVEAAHRALSGVKRDAAVLPYRIMPGCRPPASGTACDLRL